MRTPGPIARHLSEEHVRHIAVEEKVLFPALREVRGGEPHPNFVRLRIDHGALAALLVAPPARQLLLEIHAVLEPHNVVEEGPGGLYETCDEILGVRDDAVLARVRAYPRVKVAPCRDGPRVAHTADEALHASGLQVVVGRQRSGALHS